MTLLTTPTNLANVDILKNNFDLTSKTFTIDVETRKDAVIDDCYMDVAKQVKEFGGEIIYGWQIWEWRKVMIEGEFHAVWKSPEGKLVDVSRKIEGETQIVFVPDPEKIYQGRQINNIRHPLWNHALVRKLIELSDQKFKLFDDNRIGELEANIDQREIQKVERQIYQTVDKISSFPRVKNARK